VLSKTGAMMFSLKEQRGKQDILRRYQGCGTALVGQAVCLLGLGILTVIATTCTVLQEPLANPTATKRELTSSPHSTFTPVQEGEPSSLTVTQEATFTLEPVTSASPMPTPTSLPKLRVIPAWSEENDIPPQYAIRLQGGAIDTRSGEPVLPDELYIECYPSGEQGYYIVQFVGIVLPEWTDELDAIGVERLGSIPNNACLVRMTDAQRDAVAALNSVQWIGIYQPAYKIAPWIPTPLEGVSTLVVLTFPDEDVVAIREKLQEWEGVIEYDSQKKVRVAIDLRFVAPIARLKGVMWIEPWVEPKLHNKLP
jgi:hypothetical protein